MVIHRSGRAAGGLVTVALVTAGLAASLGAGYTVAQATLQDNSAYITKGTAVAHVNGESRRIDATSTGTAIAKNGDRVVVRTTPSGEVIAINQRTGATTTIDRGTMSTTNTTTPKGPVIKAPDVVSSGSKSWLIDYDARAVRPMRNGVAVGGIDIDGRPVDAAPGPDGSVLVLTREGKLYRVDTDSKVTAVDVDDAERASLTVAGGRTYLVTAGNTVVDVHSDGARQVATIPGAGPGPDGRMLTGSIQGAGTHVFVVSEALLYIVDPETGKVGNSVPLGTGTHVLGEPVEYRNRVYIPDYDDHKIVVVEVATKTVLKTRIDVPGTQRFFDLFVSGDKLWANDQYAQRLVQLDGSVEHKIDKGSGNGVKPDPSPNSTPPIRTPPVGPAPAGGTGAGGTNGNGNSGNGNGNSGNGNGNSGNGNGNSGNGNGGSTGAGKPEYVTVPAFPPGTAVDEACNRLIEFRLRCTQVPREDPGKEDGEVTGTRPTLPAKVVVGSAVTVVYVGPTEVPTIAPGTQPIDACVNAITPAGLKCSYASSPTPATDPTQYGTVAVTTPAAGTRIGNGQPVTIQYFDSFTMPDVIGKPGPDSCTNLTALSLTLPDSAGKPQPAVHPQCNQVEGDPAAKGSESTAINVYQQQPAAGTVYKPGGAPIRLTTHSAKVDLHDYTLRRGNYQNDADQAVADCSRYFTCSLSEQTRPAVDNGAHAEWVNKVAAMLGADGNEIAPNQKYAIGSTVVRIVKYVDQTTVPNVAGMSPAAACDAITRAGFTCAGNPNEPNRTANVVTTQNPAADATLGIGSQVQYNYFDKQVRALVKLYQTADPWVHLLRVMDAGEAPPAGYAVNGTMGFALTPGTYVKEWAASEFHGNCDGHTDNIVYSHGTPGGNCFTSPSLGSAADLLVPNGDTCGAGAVWLWRIKHDLTINGQTKPSYDIVTNTANKGDLPPQGAGYNEPLGCVYPS